MSNEFLSQDEVDALLKGVNGEVEPPPEEPPLTDGVRPYNLATQERIVRGRMPTLEIINQRFARLLRLGLFNFMRRNPDITVGAVRVLKYSEFIRNLVVPANLNIVQMKPLRGNSLFIFDPALVFLIIDNLFGGDGRFHTRIEGRDFTITEQRIIQRLLEVVFQDYEKSWQTVYPVKFEFIRSEMHTQFANIANPSEVVVATTFNIELGSSGGQFHVCIPYSTIEPIRDLLYSSMQGDQMEPDKRWLRMLSHQVQGAEVELVANLTEVSVTCKQILNMKVGDVIMLDVKPNLTAEVGGVPLFDCGYGISNGQYAVKIGKTITPSSQEQQMGEERAR
jgi:flagellar motor switch protein FliM